MIGPIRAWRRYDRTFRGWGWYDRTNQSAQRKGSKQFFIRNGLNGNVQRWTEICTEGFSRIRSCFCFTSSWTRWLRLAGVLNNVKQRPYWEINCCPARPDKRFQGRNEVLKVRLKFSRARLKFSRPDWSSEGQTEVLKSAKCKHEYHVSRGLHYAFHLFWI